LDLEKNDGTENERKEGEAWNLIERSFKLLKKPCKMALDKFSRVSVNQGAETSSIPPFHLI